MSEKLELAEKRMTEIQAQIASSEEQKKLLPRFHFSSPCGWINDPNGFCFFDGEFHLFAQWHPYSTRWGPMHWCHPRFFKKSRKMENASASNRA